MDDDSMLDVLQDPLLTLVVLILFGTLWIIIPADRAPAGAISREEIQKQIQQLERVVDELEARRDETARQLQQATRGEQGREVAALEVRLASLEVRSRDLRASIRNSTSELVALQRKLLEKSRQRERRARAARPGEAEETATKIRVEERLISDLRRQVEALDRVREARQGTPVYGSKGTRGKKQVSWEAANSQIYQITTENYDTEEVSFGGGIALKLYLKTSARGDTVRDMDNTGSQFRQALARLSPSTHYHVFAVRGDSYDAFLKARVLAEAADYSVGWVPFGDSPIFSSEGDSSGARVRQ